MALTRVKTLLNAAVTATGTGAWIDLRGLGEVVALQLVASAATGATYAVKVQTSPDQAAATIRDVEDFASVTGAGAQYLERMINSTGAVEDAYVLQWDIAHFSRYARVDYVRTAGTVTLAVTAYAEGSI
jgi:hypothetical protein